MSKASVPMSRSLRHSRSLVKSLSLSPTFPYTFFHPSPFSLPVRFAATVSQRSIQKKLPSHIFLQRPLPPLNFAILNYHSCFTSARNSPKIPIFSKKT